MNDSLDDIKAELEALNQQMRESMNGFEKAAREIVKLERKYYYGDTRNYKRLQEIREIVARCSKEL